MEQHIKALKRANETRFARAKLKRQINAGSSSVAHVLRAPAEYVQKMGVEELLRAQGWWGPQRAMRAMRASTVPKGRSVEGLCDATIGALTQAERERLADQVEVRR